MRPSAFLTAEWKSLVVYTVPVDRAVLEPHVPIGTELDLWQGEALVSVVGFCFLNTRLLGWAIPFHRHFTEVNLRFYVRRQVEGGWRRGVVFLREIVPLPAVSWVANGIYHENYVTRRMRHEVVLPNEAASCGRAHYAWREGDAWLELSATVSGRPQPLVAGSDAEFVLEHYWGYSRRNQQATYEYGVEHPPWRVWSTETCTFTGDASRLYGPAIAEALRGTPHSTVVADGSAVVVRAGTKLTASDVSNANFFRDAATA